ncbi:MAG: hypothetical protein SGI72_13040 [Planctomycetota bacterium]|nr:hypothetical protein [Planctomycetota bacterium]
MRDEFLSEEDLDLRNMSQNELLAYWQLWLEQAQSTNDLDEDLYSHGVFTRAPRSNPVPSQGESEFRERGSV